MSGVSPVALLSPVPFEHLSDGVDVCTRRGKVAFGSQAWTVFDKFENVGGIGAPVLIYASHPTERLGAVVSWVARYLGYVESVGGRHPDKMRHRPPSCHVEDKSGHWAGFYEVEGLRRLDETELVRISTLRNPDNRAFKSGFVPEGPTIIALPAGAVPCPRVKRAD